MKKITTLLIILILAACSTQRYSIDEILGKNNIIKGQLNWTEWKKHAQWIDYDADNYNPDQKALETLKTAIENYQPNFILFAASWCHDCQSEVPKIYKIFREINVSENFVQLIGVDKNKQDIKGMADDMNIKKVPTLLIFTEGKEKGRIVEFPKLSWEQDMADIILGME